jgi:3-deoxy-D-manno-octulosonic-acid transferase
MNILYGIYTLFNTAFVSTVTLPFLIYTYINGKYKTNFKERLGCVSSKIIPRIKGSPLVWIHAVSLGEIRVAGSIITSLRSLNTNYSIILSTTTEHGRKLAEELLDDSIPVIYGPVDYIISVRKILKRINPEAMVFLETEIWPAWITEARRLGIKTVLVNGRISPRSFKKYLRFKPFFKKVLKNIDHFSMISEIDKSRMAAIGADPNRIIVNGNAKYDMIIDHTDSETKEDMGKRLNIDSLDKVIIAGSTRTGEEIVLLKAFRSIITEFHDTILIIAPRHLERVKEICSLLEDQNFKYELISEMDGEKSIRRENILIVDSYGELFSIYSIGSIAFCGASLVPLGGQNPFEPAVWGVPVIYGPHMEDFLDAKVLLEKYGGGAEIKGHEDLAEKIKDLLRDTSTMKKMGENAKKALMENRDASVRHARVIAELLNK